MQQVCLIQNTTCILAKTSIKPKVPVIDRGAAFSICLMRFNGALQMTVIHLIQKITKVN